MTIVNLLQFGPIFGFVLVTALSYGVMHKTKIFGGDSNSIDLIVATMLGLFSVSSNVFRSILRDLVPYFLILVVFMFFTILMFLMLGVDEKTIASAFQDESEATVIIVTTSAIVLIVLINQFYSKITEISWLNKNSYVLGLIVFFIIAGFTVRQIAYEVPYPGKK